MFSIFSQRHRVIRVHSMRSFARLVQRHKVREVTLCPRAVEKTGALSGVMFSISSTRITFELIFEACFEPMRQIIYAECIRSFKGAEVMGLSSIMALQQKKAALLEIEPTVQLRIEELKLMLPEIAVSLVPLENRLYMETEPFWAR